MKPKYKLNQEITELSNSLPDITKEQIQWGFDYCLIKYFHQSRGKNYCLECGTSWKPGNVYKKQICPGCNNNLKKINQYRFRGKESNYMAVVTICGGYQVVRIILIHKIQAMNFKAEYFSKEVMQHWIDETGAYTTMSLSVNGMSSAADVWCYSSEMKVRQFDSYKARFRQNISPYATFPKANILQIYKRNGFKGDFHAISPIEFFSELLRGQYFETLLKVKQYSLMRLSQTRSLHYRYWPAIKICIRNKYTVKDARMWVDYIDLLVYFRKDIRNAKFVCPKNLKAEHDRLMVKKRKIQELESAEKKKRDIEKATADFLREKQKFFDLRFYDEETDLEIVVLNNIEEFRKEGDELKHCVFTNAYYSKPDSLILSARKEEKRIETIEFLLSKMEVVQCRGYSNENTEYHDKIIELVRNNTEKIMQRAV